MHLDSRALPCAESSKVQFGTCLFARAGYYGVYTTTSNFDCLVLKFRRLCETPESK